ncbi:MAG: phage capsid protein [Burkholderiaceae bacterium]
MPQSITQAFVQQWDNAIRMQAQQKESRLESTVSDRGSITGESFTANRVAPIEDTPEQTVRHGDTVWSDAPHTTRVALMRPFYQAIPIDRNDETRVLANPAPVYNESLASAWNRRKDKLIFAALLGNAQTKEGSQVALGAGQLIAAGGTGFTRPKIIQAKKLFRRNEADAYAGEEIYCAYNSEAMEDVLTDTTLTSSDFMAVKMLYQGDVGGKWLGINWIPYESINFVGGTYTTAMWTKTSLMKGTAGIGGSAARRADKQDLLQLSMNGNFGAVRVEEEKVVSISFV